MGHGGTCEKTKKAQECVDPEQASSGVKLGRKRRWLDVCG